MDEEQHYMRFSNDEYEGGEYIGEDFFYRSKAEGRTQTKEQQLYGIFADDSDEETTGRGGKRRRQEQADLSKPVAFVSHGVTGSSTEKPEDIDKAEHQTSGLGGNGNAAGLGFAGGGLGFEPAKAAGEDVDEDMDIAELPTRFGQRILQSAKERQRENAERERKKAERERRQTGGRASTSAAAPVFEQHTKGIGSKLLEAMGYKPGQGLGRNRQGIASALEAKIRPKNMGMGFNDYEEHKLEKETKPKTEPPKAKEKAVEPRLWKKTKAVERMRREYRTADELLADSAEKPASAVQPILDMRGPQARLVTDMDSLNAEHAQEGNGTPMPELQHNLQLLVDLAAAEIQRVDGKLRHEKDTAVILGREAQRLATEAENARAQAERIGAVLERVSQAQAADAAALLADLQQLYEQLRADYPEEYLMYNLPAIALTQVLPRLTALMAGSAPLSHPSHGLAEALAWRPLLESPGQRDAVFADAATAATDPYTALLTAAVVPGLATAITNLWEPRDPEPMLRWTESWQSALPTGVQITILDTLVFPKVSRAVEAWEPQAESVPLHAWLHPWLPWLGPRLESLYPGIRFRLSTALQQWHPSDASALALLSPWHTVFEAKDWEALMVRSILPKLAWALSDALVINPALQDLTPWHWVTAWAPVTPPHLMVSLLEAHFFPKWHNVLRAWLAHAPNYEEISNWYVGWKGALPAEVQGNERIRAQLAGALSLVDAAMEGQALPAFATPVARDAYAAAAAAAAGPAVGPAASRWGGGATPPAVAEPTLRQMVELYAEQNNLDFVPKAGRRHEGLQVYGFGLVSIVLDNMHNSVRAQQTDGRWAPTTLEELVMEHTKRASKR